MSAEPKRQRKRGWFIVRETVNSTFYRALPLLNSNAAWTNNVALAAAYFTRSEAGDVLRWLRGNGECGIRVVPVWL